MASSFQVKKRFQSPFPSPLGIAAMITGFISLGKVKDGSGGGKGMAIAGIVLGIIGIVLGIANVILGLAMQGSGWQEKWLEEMQRQQQQQ